MSAGAQPAQQKKLILVAEDDPAIATLLTRILRQEYQVVHVTDGPAALARAAGEPRPDLLLLDIMMPGIDGLDVARRLRLNPELKRIPIIFLTAKTAPTDVIKGIQHGARSYITKPFKLDDVLAKVKKALSK
jgi:CheY-like chemotaxis protein